MVSFRAPGSTNPPILSNISVHFVRFGLGGRRLIRLLTLFTGLAVYRIGGLPDWQLNGLAVYQIGGSPDWRFTGLPVYRIGGLQDWRVTGEAVTGGGG